MPSFKREHLASLEKAFAEAGLPILKADSGVGKSTFRFKNSHEYAQRAVGFPEMKDPNVAKAYENADRTLSEEEFFARYMGKTAPRADESPAGIPGSDEAEEKKLVETPASSSLVRAPAAAMVAGEGAKQAAAILKSQ